MSRRGNCYDNAVMESFFSTVKFELGEHFDSCGEAKMQLFDYIERFYNQQRRHSTIGYVSPATFERGAKACAIARDLNVGGVPYPSVTEERRSSGILCRRA
jgi:hypothetical protein